MNQKVNKILFLIFVVIFSSCDDKRFYDAYINLDGKWNKENKLKFSFEQQDTLNVYNMFITIRNNNEYPYSNLFVITKLTQPSNEIRVDTLEYVMANPDGTLLGEGITDTKHSKLWYKENFKFSKAGKYTLSIEQANRETGKVQGVQDLEGVTEVGFRIEKK